MMDAADGLVVPPGSRRDPAVSIAVAVCTRERPEQLACVLDSLTRQTLSAERVIVVDNAPTSPRTAQLVRERHPACRYVVEPVQGLDFARNRALRTCDTSVLAFTDDDVVLSPDWIEATARVMAESPRIAACMGRVRALAPSTPGSLLFEANGGFDRGDRRIDLPPGAGPRPPGWPRPLIAWSIGIGCGASMALRRDAALAVGGFDEALDMGAALPGGGEVDMLWRLLDAGYQVVYDPGVLAWHEHRATRDDAERQILGHNRATIAMLTKELGRARGAGRLPIAAFLLWRLVKPFVRILKRLAGRDPLPLPTLVRLVAAVWRGLAAYPAARALAADRKAAAT
jgi:GT2 family glycosyltransferase